MARRSVLAGLVVAVGLLLPAAAPAGPLFGPKKRDADCPPPSYPCTHYWTPALSRLNAHFHGPSLSVYPTDRHPDVPATYQFIKYPCPAVDPAVLVNQRDLLR